MISADAVRTLVGSTEVAADMEGAFLSIEELRKSWEVGRTAVGQLKHQFIVM